MRDIIESYFQSWIRKDPKVIEGHFSEDVVYVECYGPVYEGKEQCLRWFEDWNAKGDVLEWSIKAVEEGATKCFVEWFFRCVLEGKEDEFDGVSIIEFENGTITSIREFRSQSDHYFPYGQ